jgi:hypothetical protein
MAGSSMVDFICLLNDLTDSSVGRFQVKSFLHCLLSKEFCAARRIDLRPAILRETQLAEVLETKAGISRNNTKFFRVVDVSVRLHGVSTGRRIEFYPKTLVPPPCK